MDIATAKEVIFTNVVPIALRVVGAIVLWVGGRWLIGGVRRVLAAGAVARKVDPTLVRYLDSALQIMLTLLLFLAALSIFGVETTSFAGLIAAAGVALGMAWSGLLSNFAAGVFILGLQPFKVSDVIGVAGISGTVQEIGMFNTAIDTGDNVRTWIGNARIFGDNIQNFTTNGWRRVEVKVPLPAGVDVLAALLALRELAAKVPDVMAEPVPTTELAAIDGNGVVAVKVAAPARRHAHVQSELNKSVMAWLKAPTSVPAPVAGRGTG
jgi:small conductance mechanosensitive channel